MKLSCIWPVGLPNQVTAIFDSTEANSYGEWVNSAVINEFENEDDDKSV